ncbi:50S ribosomal protein L18 [Candidatus Woesearchaeota archaeon]|nr:50S ribosomal protein L18 [Candidatus Woesearchaeota archaeon]
MARSRRYTVRLKRDRSGKTNYKSRLKTLGSKNTRLVVRKKINIIIAQLIDYKDDGDKIILSLTTKDLTKFGWKYHFNNIPSSYLLGFLTGIRSKEKGVNKVIFDIGLHASVKGSSLYAVLKGAVDSGLDISVNQDILPSEERVSGKHIENYASKIKGTEIYKKQFSRYVKNNVKPEEISKTFLEVKKRIGVK